MRDKENTATSTLASGKGTLLILQATTPGADETKSNECTVYDATSFLPPLFLAFLFRVFSLLPELLLPLGLLGVVRSPLLLSPKTAAKRASPHPKSATTVPLGLDLTNWMATSTGCFGHPFVCDWKPSWYCVKMVGSCCIFSKASLPHVVYNSSFKERKRLPKRRSRILAKSEEELEAAAVSVVAVVTTALVAAVGAVAATALPGAAVVDSLVASGSVAAASVFCFFKAGSLIALSLPASSFASTSPLTSPPSLTSASSTLDCLDIWSCL
mmetsp:Transcript_13576/g.23983  ORF Transcript_13576/g.23983 Transcript_13576/m.23983 type:complete len:270 (+) Transcript_13576:549-1358(+)